MRTEHTPPREAGFTLVELLLGIVVFLVSAIVLGDHITTNYNATNSQRDQVFAYAKAHAILSEIHGLVDRGDVEAAVDLDVLDDGITPRPQLTVTTDEAGDLLPPDHPISGNVMRAGNWAWSRQLSVQPFAGLDNRNVRYVTVRILKRDARGREHEMASLSSVVNSVSTSFPATQVFDVYLLAMENVPGWWVFMETIVPFVESAVTDLENRNPGLSVRTHWITKLGFGRNTVYRPYVNHDVDSEQPVNRVYYYPGAMPAGSASTLYYVPDLMKGRLKVDDAEYNSWNATTNPYPYALADYYNHCTRWPRAKELNDQRVQAAAAREEDIRQARLAGTPPPPELGDMSTEPTLQVLLEQMNSQPEDFEHALVVNLHGELLPAPPLRNYSDPAKDPRDLPGLRVVTHAEELRTHSPPAPVGEETAVRLRVYCYKTDPSDTTIPDIVPWERAVVVNVMDLDLTEGSGNGRLHPDVSIDRIAGGVWVGGTNEYQSPSPAPFYYDSLVAEEMSYYAHFYDPGPGERKMTRLYLFYTPTTSPPVSDKGLWTNRRSRLYGLEYVPSPLGPGGDFSRDLSVVGDGPKNTARWVIEIPATMWDQQRFVDTEYPPSYYDPRNRGEQDHLLTVRTKFWNLNNVSSALLSGTSPNGTVNYWHKPDNESETYTWWAQSRDAVPWTERSQIFGDPRHNPYKDLLNGDPDFGDGYNWFFDDLYRGAASEDARVDFPGITRRWDRYNVGPNFDVPRLMSLYRRAIVSTHSIYTTLSGYSYYYVGCGNEIGYDSANGYPNSIPVNLKPWGGTENSTGYVDSITGTRSYVRASGVSDYWWGMPWLGELYPDSAYLSQWVSLDAEGTVEGNLRTGNSVGVFHRDDVQSVHDGNARWQAWGTEMRTSHHRTDTRGAVSFFNNGSSTSHFNHHFSSGDGSLIGPGVELAENYGFPIPDSIYINRPFSLNTSGNEPPEGGYDPYLSERYSARLMAGYYDHPSGHHGSGLVELIDPTGTDAAWIVVSGIGETTTVGSDFLAKYCLLSMYQSYFELGDQTLTWRIPQPPRIEIASPTEITELNNPASIDIQIELSWQRWDGLPYTTTTPSGFAEDETQIDYVVVYSPDNGVNFHHIQDDSLAVLGERPEDPSLIIADAGVGSETVTWNTPSWKFPEGSYLIRVEAFRRGQPLHYSVHQVRVYVQR